MAKMVFSYFASLYYFNGDGFSVRMNTLVHNFGCSRTKIEKSLTSLIKKKFICIYGMLSDDSVSVFMNKKIIENRLPGFLSKKERIQNAPREEDEILEDMVRKERKSKGYSTYKRVCINRRIDEISKQCT